MCTKKTFRRMCRILRNANCIFRIAQNRHIKISVTNLENAQSTFLILATSPSDVNYEKAFFKQSAHNLRQIGIEINDDYK